jgi:hypothetical protein
MAPSGKVAASKSHVAAPSGRGVEAEHLGADTAKVDSMIRGTLNG